MPQTRVQFNNAIADFTHSSRQPGRHPVPLALGLARPRAAAEQRSAVGGCPPALALAPARLLVLSHHVGAARLALPALPALALWLHVAGEHERRHVQVRHVRVGVAVVELVLGVAETDAEPALP